MTGLVGNGKQHDSSTNEGNYNLKNIVTPIKVDELEKMLMDSKYNETETRFLVDGFRNGFALGYQGPENRQDESDTIPFREVGSKEEMWEKLMSEVELGRYAGPFESIPYKNFAQSPIGLVPKKGNKTRLIFHLSFDFKSNPSINSCTPKDICSVKYNDLDDAVRICLWKIKNRRNRQDKLWTGKDQIFFGKTDLSSAFRMIPTLPAHWKWMIMKAVDPETGKTMFFVDKCLPFGSSISWSHFQHLSNALRHLLQHITGRKDIVINYLDDFLFISMEKGDCDMLIQEFLNLCKRLGVLVADKKTEWSDLRMVFLGILLDGENHVLSIPEEKRIKAIKLLNLFIGRRKATVKELQKLSGYLNFLTRVIFPGRTFTRRMYAKFSKTLNDKKMKSYYHIKLDQEFKEDCRTWLEFLDKDQIKLQVCRPWLDMDKNYAASELKFFTDASARTENGGMGGIYEDQWIMGQWNKDFLADKKPSIEFLELFALCAGFLTWANRLKDKRFTVFCDNQAVVNMVNNLSSSCKNCMRLLRIIVKLSLNNKFRVFTKYVSSADNDLSDALSRNQLDWFFSICEEKQIPVKKNTESLPPEIWPPEKYWID